jgi:hypothetical protein
VSARAAAFAGGRFGVLGSSQEFETLTFEHLNACTSVG